MKKNKTLNINFDVPIFSALNAPKGFLNSDLACHALWYYATLTKKNMEHRFKAPQYEDEEREKDFHKNQKELFKSVATMYGVAPERMLHFWSNIDIQMTIMGGDRLPASVRFQTVPEVRTQ